MVISKDQLWESGHDETVEVNQRALIDKVLARYSGEFTVFRELLQNSDDAQSKAVEIRFETQSYLAQKTGSSGVESAVSTSGVSEQLPDLKTTHVHRWTFKNNGIIFRDEDWNRLKKIAEGNPDEEKIGAFGVGFYSLFSVTEEPFVTSGNQWMAFYWKDKKDQLFARRGNLPETDQDPSSKAWTSFEMPLREAAPIPLAFDFTRFLVSSLTFMVHLREVTVYFDDKRLVKLNKAAGLPSELGIPKGLRNRSPAGTMTVDTIQTTPLHIQAQVMKWIYTSGSEKKRINAPKPSKPAASGGGFFSSLFSSFSGTSTPQRVSTPLPPAPPPVDHLAISETSVSLSIYSASVQVRLDKKLSSEIQRSTKKNPPTKMKFELIYTAKDEYDSSLEEEARHPEATGSIFQGLRADLEGVGAARVFIGHSTAQSTGIGGHIAARFIPTVERESIDFMDRNVAVWNRELLYVGGFLSRAVYEIELSAVQKEWTAATQSSPDSPKEETQTKLINRVLHDLKFFMFYPSTPSPDVSNMMEAAFFDCSTNGHFPIVSNKGIRDARTVRLHDATFSGFLKNLPTLPESVLSGASTIVSSLQSRGMIKSINFQDVLQELQSRPLPEGEFVACLNWWINTFRDGDHERLLPIRRQVVDAIILSIESSSDPPKIVPLSSIKHFINPRSTSGNIPLDGPLPDYLLPLSISKLFKPDDLKTCLPWTEFTVTHWISYICSSESFPVEYDINSSPIWAERVIGLIVRVWPTLAVGSKAEILRLLKAKTCMPTSGGMLLPTQAYFPNVNIFGDLPVVTFPGGLAIKGTAEKVLQELGVRKHVELQLIFNRMIKTNEWTIADLIKYLVSVRSSLTSEEFERLKATSAFPAEGQVEGSDTGKRTRYKAKELYEPLDVFRNLKLPVIDWGHHTKWKSSSEEAKFLFDLGLRRQPPLNTLIELCAGEDANVRSVALKYLIDNLETKYQDYDPMPFKNIRYIPALRGSEQCLATVQEVYSSQWAAVGFLVLRPEYQQYASKLKVREHPPVPQLIALLESKPPKDDAEARVLFRLLAERVNDFRNSDLQTLSTMPFVPIKAEKGAAGPTVRWLPPSQCYLSGEGGESFHSKLFIFVDFGSAANAFLTACGTRSRPSVEEVAKILLSNPRHFYDLAGGPNNFLSELRNLAVNAKALSSTTLLRMKRSPVLLALQRKPQHQNKEPDNWDEDEWDIIYDLKKPSEVIIADDTHSYQAFGDSLFTAPQEDIIEAFYASLGSPRLSQVVREEYQTTVELHDSKTAAETRSLILERLPLFLHEHTHARTRVSFSWLSADKNFVVRAFGKLGVIKSLRYGHLNLSRKQDASAVAQRVGSGPIELWIAGHSQPDMYEVATSLNRLLFESPKANDALLFMTILSTDLRSLKRRGYNVDRILRQQREARLAAESARAAKEQESHLAVAKQGVDNPRKAEVEKPNVQAAGHGLEEKRPSSPSPSTQISGALQNWRRKFGAITGSAPDRGPPSPPGSWRDSVDTVTNAPEQVKPLPPRPSSPRSGVDPIPTSTADVGAGVTPRNNIAKNIDMAINSCRSESADLLQNREHMQRVKETLNDGYCDISGRKGDLHNIGQMGAVKVYLSEEIPTSQAASFMEAKRDSLARFIHIMAPLADVYQLPLTKMHIFYDLKGGIIAFNRNGSIFLNLRYFEQWRKHIPYVRRIPSYPEVADDADVKDDKLQAAYISWYFTIAHEIAHNLVQPHNSEHEFYFSAICEQFLLPLSSVLQSVARS